MKNAKQLPWIGKITREEVSKHNKKDDCWVIIQGFVYDITSYLQVHPGGLKCIIDSAGGDITKKFNQAHPWVSMELISKLRIGEVSN